MMRSNAEMSTDKADALMKDGENELTKFAPFTSSESRRDKARDKFIQAGAQYKASNSWLLAATSFQRASEMASKNKCESDFVSDCEEAAKCFKKAKDKRATDLFEKVVDMYAQQQRFPQAAKYCLEIAQTAEGADSVTWMNKAVRYFKSANSKVSATETTLQIAEVYLKMNDFVEARKIYGRQARDALDDRLARGGARKLIFMALLCEMASISGTNMGEGVDSLRRNFEEFQELDTQFTEHTREHMFIAQAIDAFEEQSLEKFDDAVGEYDNICPLDEIKMKLVIKAKQALRHTDFK